MSFRREDLGSWYVQAIVDVFSQHAHEKDINSLLTMVNRKVATCSTTDHAFKQMPAPVNHLMKDFYFFPGLYEINQEPAETEEGVGTCVQEQGDEEKMDVSPDTGKGIDMHDSHQKECQCKGKGRKKGQEYPRYSTL